MSVVSKKSLMKIPSVNPHAHEGDQEGVLTPLQGLVLGSKWNDT